VRPISSLLQLAQAKTVVGEVFAQAGVAIDGTAAHDIRVHDQRFYARLVRDGSLGLGESYVDGWWDCDQLDELIARLLRARQHRPWPFVWRATLARTLATFERHSPAQSRKFVAAHYDLGNEFFATMLGPTMTYSCGYWRDAQDLDSAQVAKHQLICRKLGLRERDTLLDIGCGWGALAFHAASTIGCRVVGITLSAPQTAYARQRCHGLPVQIEQLDYRDRAVESLGPFSKISSVGMFEHVGARNYSGFMKRAAHLLAPDGLMLLHTVGRHASAATDPWVSRYIFPGGMLPCVEEIAEAIDGQFVIEDWHNFGADYDRTLLSWYQNCRAELAVRGPRFERLWRFYLLAFAGNFRTRYRNQLWQIVLSPHGQPGGYVSLR
jgi:cyclopropane-fatty-acyl-phospholipid synthase